MIYFLPVKRIGDYEVVGTAGHGGMGTVFKAVRPTDGSPCAVKVFDVGAAANRAALAKKFLAEAKLAARLSHPNIVRVTDRGETEDGRPFLVMDFVGDGRSLADEIALNPPAAERTLSLYREIRSALACCHAHGVVHADLKAENVLLDSEGHAVLADFGIARVLDPVLRHDLSLTSSTLPVNLGTPYALAPECTRGELATPASDVYAFGVLLFKLTTGIWYEGSVRLLDELDKLAPEWSPLLRRMLAADPARRPADACELPDDPLVAPRRRLHPVISAGAASLAAALVVAGAYLLSRGSPDVTPSDSGPARVRVEEIRGGYVPYAVLTPADTLVLTGAVHFGTVVLPDTNGYVHIRAPKGFSGTLVSADHAEGSLFSQFHVDREPGMRVIIRGNSEIIVRQQ